MNFSCKPSGSSLRCALQQCDLVGRSVCFLGLTPVNLGGALTRRHFLRQISIRHRRQPGASQAPVPVARLSDGPTRRRSTSQRCDPGSRTPPAHWRIGTKSCGQRIATMPSRSENSTGPMRAGRAGGVSKTPPPRKMPHPSGSLRSSLVKAHKAHKTWPRPPQATGKNSPKTPRKNSLFSLFPG